MQSFTGILTHERAGSGTSTQLGSCIISQVSLTGLISQGAAIIPDRERPKQQLTTARILLIDYAVFNEKAGRSGRPPRLRFKFS
jgi:hypothetical protein